MARLRSAGNQGGCPVVEVDQKSPGCVKNVENDPDVWSGRASQEVFVEVAVSGLASMYPASDWSVLCSGPPWSDGLFFSSRRRHTRLQGDWSSDVCSSD